MLRCQLGKRRMRQAALALYNDGRKIVKEIMKKGDAKPRAAARACVLPGFDRGVRESELINVLEASRGTIWKARKSCDEGGLINAAYEENN